MQVRDNRVSKLGVAQRVSVDLGSSLAIAVFVNH